MATICQRCNARPATVHLTDIVNKKKRELHLCEECARQQQLIPEGPGTSLNLQALVSLIMGQPAPEAEPGALICPTCGLQYAVFRAEGRFGCPDDYDAFRPVLEPLLERIHRGTQHQGKTPRHEAQRRKRQAETASLRAELAEAVAAERYEEAARLRDRIRQKEGTDESR
jgi:protein arginine kinase activator